MMNERKRLEYEQLKKSWPLALMFASMFGPFGLIYSRQFLIPTVMICCMLYRMRMLISCLFPLNLEGFVAHLAWAVGLWIGSLFLAPILVSSYNNQLKKRL